MQKVTELYPPEISKRKLENLFSGNQVMLDAIRGMSKSNMCVFAALCDGHVVTTTGYSITADLCVNRASAVTHSLKKKHLPISSMGVSTKADVGGAVKQAAFFVSEDDLARLKTEPEKIMKECERDLNSKKRSSAQKDMIRLYKEFGEEGVLALLRNVPDRKLDS
jgi:hypothetical protein